MANFYATYSASESSGSAVTASQGTIPWIVAGNGVAGTPQTSVVTIQGNASGVPLPISGSITASNASIAATGAAVPASSTYIGASVGGTMTGLVATANGLKVDGSAATQPISGTVAATQSGAWNITNVSGTVSLPTGAATQTTLNDILTRFPPAVGPFSTSSSISVTMATNQPNIPVSATQLPTTLGQKNSDNSMAVVIASDQSAVPVSGTVTATGTVAATQSGTWTVQPGNTANTTPWLMVESKIKANAPVTNLYSSVNVTTSAYVQLVASSTSAMTRLYIQDTGGSFMIIATGAGGAEVDQFYYGPGFAGFIDFAIPASTRIAIKALDATASTGRLIVSFFT